MKPTPTQVEAAARSLWDRLSPDFTFDEARRLNHSQYVWVMGDAEAALSAALSHPAAAVVGEPVAWTSVGQLKAVAEGMNATITKNGDEFMNIPLYAFNLSESPQEAFARWLNDGPKLAKSAGVYVGISVKPAPPALGGASHE